ncbi:MAG: heavy metal transporter [Acidimicrobiales bacterium]|nr:MAG: heavy metal transporter [Acidimicrobiales bacterium]
MSNHLTSPSTTTITLLVDGMHCSSCGLLIDDALEDVAGVITAQTNVRTSTTTVVLDTDTGSVGAVAAAITALGYTVREGS